MLGSASAQLSRRDVTSPCANGGEGRARASSVLMRARAPPATGAPPSSGGSKAGASISRRPAEIRSRPASERGRAQGSASGPGGPTSSKIDAAGRGAVSERRASRSRSAAADRQHDPWAQRVVNRERELQRRDEAREQRRPVSERLIAVMEAKMRSFEPKTWSDTEHTLRLYEQFAALVFLECQCDVRAGRAEDAERGSARGFPYLDGGGLAPPQPDMVECFYLFLVTEAYERKDGRIGYAPGTARNKISSLGRWFKIRHGVDIVARCPGLGALQRGLDKDWVNAGNDGPQARSKPIMAALLRQVLEKVAAEPRSRDNVMFAAASSSSFSWLLRWSELGRSSGGADSNDDASEVQLRLMSRIHWSRLRFLDAMHRVVPIESIIASAAVGESVEWVDWGFGRQKNDRVYGGQLRSVQRPHGAPQYCTVALLVDLLIMVGRTAGFKVTDPVFFDRDKTEGSRGLSNKVYNKTLRRLLIGCSDGGTVLDAVSVMDRSHHGHRGGACTELFHLGVSEDRIMALGRWRSSAYLAYRQLAREFFGETAASMMLAPERHILEGSGGPQ